MRKYESLWKKECTVIVIAYNIFMPLPTYTFTSKIGGIRGCNRVTCWRLKHIKLNYDNLVNGYILIVIMLTRRPRRSASLPFSTCETKKPVPYSRPPRNENPNDRDILERFRLRRTIRIRLFWRWRVCCWSLNAVIKLLLSTFEPSSDIFVTQCWPTFNAEINIKKNQLYVIRQ